MGTSKLIGAWSLVKIKGVPNQQIVLNDELNKITASYTVIAKGTYDKLEEFVYNQLNKRSKNHGK